MLAFGDSSLENRARLRLRADGMIIAGAVSSIEELEVGCARLTPEVVVSDL
jgi:hypothetical protein